jgi:hypothetical protein
VWEQLCLQKRTVGGGRGLGITAYRPLQASGEVWVSDDITGIRMSMAHWPRRCLVGKKKYLSVTSDMSKTCQEGVFEY